MALFNLSCSVEIHETILEQGGVQAVITLLTSSTNAEVSTPSHHTSANHSAPFLSFIFIFLPSSACLTNASRLKVVLNCVKSAFNLSVGEDAQGQIIGRRGVPVLVDVAGRPSTPLPVRKLVASTLFNISNLLGKGAPKLLFH